MVMHHRSKNVLRVAGIIVGLACVVVGVKWTGVGAIRAALSQVGGNIAWMFVAYTAGTAVAAVPWRELLPLWLRPSWGATLTSRFAASGVNALLPFFGLGEATRMLWLPRGQRTPGLAALVIDRLLFLAAGTPILVVAALVATRVPGVPRSYEIAALVSAGIISIAVAAVAVGAARGRLVGRLRWALVVFGVPPTPHQGKGKESRGDDVNPVDRELHALLTGPRAPIVRGFVLHTVARLLLALEIYAGLRILGAHVGPAGTLDLHRDPRRAVDHRHVRAGPDRPAGRRVRAGRCRARDRTSNRNRAGLFAAVETIGLRSPSRPSDCPGALRPRYV